MPSLAIVEFDGARIRTRKTGCGPGVHLENKDWNESKNAIFVSATSETSDTRDDRAGANKKDDAAHKPKPLLRTVISSMKNSREFGGQMKREAERRKFDQAARKAFVADGLTCNGTIHAEHFDDYVPLFDFPHAMSYLFTASVILFGKTDEA